MAKDLLDHRPLEDGRDDLQLPAAAVRAVLHVDVEDALEQPRPADAMRPVLNRLCLAASRTCTSLFFQTFPSGFHRCSPEPKPREITSL
jgi:hypothetical protein